MMQDLFDGVQTRNQRKDDSQMNQNSTLEFPGSFSIKMIRADVLVHQRQPIR